MDIVRPELVFLLVVAFLGLGLLVALSGPKSESEWRDAARALGGRLFAREGDHSIRLPWRGTMAVLREKPLVFDVPLFGVVAPRVSLKSGTSDGPQPVRGCVVSTADGGGAEFLQGPARALLEELARDASIEVDLGERLRIELGGADWKAGDLIHVARLCLRLAEQARHFSSRASGVTIVGEGKAEDAECQVCGGALVDDLVRCALCATTHHEDCWRYVGRCSTYGCGERSFLRA